MADRIELLNKLDELGDVLKQLGEDYVTITFRRGDHLIPDDRFLVGIEIQGAKPIDRHIHASNAKASAAFVRVLADRSDKRQELEFRAQVEAEVAARLQKAAA